MRKLWWYYSNHCRPKRGCVNHARIKPITVAEKVQEMPLANENEKRRDSAGNNKQLEMKKLSLRAEPWKD